jgi:TolB-like protein
VLPFVNEGRRDQRIFCRRRRRGIAQRVEIGGLLVASQTSAFSFKGGKIEIATVAQKLNVATILEGSVRKAGNRVRIAVQLVQVASDSTLWSKTYDRELNDIFAVQDDIAQSVVKELRSSLLGERRDISARAAVQAEVRAAAIGRGENAEAYRLYLQGRAMVARRTQHSVTTGIEHLRQAVGLDPEYALAWAALSYAQTIAAGPGGWTPFEEGYRRAREAAERALAFAPDLAEGHVALALIQWERWDWAGANASARRALLAPQCGRRARGGVGDGGFAPDESIALC